MTGSLRAQPYEVSAGAEGFRYVEHGRTADLSVRRHVHADGRDGDVRAVVVFGPPTD